MVADDPARAAKREAQNWRPADQNIQYKYGGHVWRSDIDFTDNAEELWRVSLAKGQLTASYSHLIITSL